VVTEERSVTFAAREIAEAMRYWAVMHNIAAIPSDARLTLVPHGDYQPATATLTWRAE
jgi:hypothetical protein